MLRTEIEQREHSITIPPNPITLLLTATEDPSNISKNLRSGNIRGQEGRQSYKDVLGFFFFSPSFSIY